MKRVIVLAVLAVTAIFTAQVLAHDAGYLTTVPNSYPGKSVFQVNIEKVDGKEGGLGVNTSVKPGSHEVRVSLVFDPRWGDAALSLTERDIYYANMTVDVEAGKTYFLGAKVNLQATTEEVSAGTFWEPIVFRVE